MAMELTGSLTQVNPEVTGTGRTGAAWVKQEFVIETQDQYPKKVCFNLWGADKVAELQKFATGDQLKVSFNLESREYNGRWYTEARAWKIEESQGEGFMPSSSGQESQAAAPRASRPAAPQPLPPIGNDTGDDDLPF